MVSANDARTADRSLRNNPLPQKNSHRRAVVLMMCALALLICLDASGKYLGGQGVPVAATTWSRYFGHFLVVLLLFLPRDGLLLFRAVRPSFQWARGLFMVTVTLTDSLDFKMPIPGTTFKSKRCCMD